MDKQPITLHKVTVPQTGTLQRKCVCGNHTIAADECAECRLKLLQRKAVDGKEGMAVLPIVHEVLRSPGRPLDPATRAFMEPRFGHDFSQVKVHADAQAAESARAVDALAYTVGRDIVFGSGQYALHSNSGQRLMAHELTHVVQQSQSAGTAGRNIEIIRPGSLEESEAVHNELTIHKSTRAVGVALQRHEDPNQYLGGTNMVFDSQGEARMAALAEATTLGPGHTITHDPMPTRGLPHYHVVDPAGKRVKGHFFYRTKRRRRSYKVDWNTVRRVVITLGLSLAMIAVIIAALADPEPASKLALAGLSAAMITIVLGRLSGEEADDQNSA
jgi:hypothetical protein